MRENKRMTRYMALLLSLLMLLSSVTQAWAETVIDVSEAMSLFATPTDAEAPMQEEQSPDEEIPSESPLPEKQAAEEPTFSARIAACGYAYVVTAGAARVYATPAAAEADLLYTMTQRHAILLATGWEQQHGVAMVRIWFLDETGTPLAGYIKEQDLTGDVLADEEALAGAGEPAAMVSTDAGDRYLFTAQGKKAGIEPETAAPTEMPPMGSDIATPDVLPEQPESDEPTIPAIPEPAMIQVGDFVSVTTVTRAFLGMDDRASDDYEGDLSLGVFVKDAAVRVEAVEQDSQGRDWYKVRYQYGDDYADGTLKWTAYDTIYVLANEVEPTTKQDFTVTDYALEKVPASAHRRSVSAMDGFSLKSISGSIGTFTVGQSGVYGSSGKDSTYKQIATVAGHGTVYATPHYLDGFTVYCLEHNLPGPGENISGGGQQPAGPYLIVDMDAYMNTPGNSKVIYHESTLHAIAWVLRHTYPFMALDRSDADNETWTRVAGQFAIREVIKQLEGSQYVREYWDMDNFYVASNQAPEVYLTYARWLAANGIARAAMTGKITVSSQSAVASGGRYVGTATLTTDADLIRISKDAGEITGHTAGEDSAYYYLNSGDTITVTSANPVFSLMAESVSSDEEEARFLVGVPDAAIQKVLIPQQGVPYALQSATISFEVQYGEVEVIKTDAASGAVLGGAVFELLDSAGQVVQTLTTDTTGTVTFNSILPGRYTVREASAPVGYVLSSLTTQTVAVTAGNTASVTFANERVKCKIRIVKRDQLTQEPLAGAEFSITPAIAPQATGGSTMVITTDENGVAESDWLAYGAYWVTESKTPEHYVDSGFSTLVNAHEDGKIYAIEVENEPAKGWIRLVKTDRLNGNPIEGVQFDIYYNDEYGDGLAATMVTGADGIALSEPLRKGRYIGKEHGTAAGYAWEEITLDAAVKSDEITELTATNQPVQVRLKLYKRDAWEYGEEESSIAPYALESIAPLTRGDGVLTGAEFQVRAGEDILDRQGNVVFMKGEVVVASIQTAGEDASATTDELWPGLYEVVEIAPPEGYQLNRRSVYVDARSAAAQSQEAVITYESVVTDESLYGALAIVKVLGDPDAPDDPARVETPEPDAAFEIYLKSAGAYESTRDFERDYLVTDKNGYAMTKPLPYGIYTIQQVKGREGYEVKGPIDVRITGEESLVNPPIVTLSDQPIQYRLKFIKTDSETGKTIVLSNASFKLKDANGDYVKQKVYYPREQEIDTFTTDETGSVTLPETVTWGMYFVEEVKAPEGYLIRTEDVAVLVGSAGDTPGETYQLDIEIPNDPVKGRILLDKKGLQLTGFAVSTDAWGNEVHTPVYEEGYLAGAVFEVYAAEDVTGKDGTVWHQAGELADTMITTGNGADASKELPLGRYNLVEVSAPEGYLFDSQPIPVELKYGDDRTALVEAHTTIENDFLPAEITLWKEKAVIRIVSSGEDGVKSVLTDEPGEGFVFGLFSAKDIHYAGGTLPADTLIASGATDNNGMLTFSGYYPHGEYYIKELYAPEGWKANAERIPVSIHPAQANSEHVIRVSLDAPIHNELIHGKVTLTKTDITGANTIPGALIEVRNEQEAIIYWAYTDENGEIPDIPVAPGRYTFREVLAPEGYALNEAVMTFTVDAEGGITGDTVIRDEYTRVSLLKQDEKGQPLAGAVFGLFGAGDSPLMTAASDEDGIVQFNRIPNGQYTIREIQAPEGYLLSHETLSLTMDAAWQNSHEPLATFTNQLKRIMLLKTDTAGHPLPGVGFSLINAATGEIAETQVSDENGLFVFTGFQDGDWMVRENEAPAGFNRMEDITFHVDETWKEPAPMLCVNIPNHYEFVKTDHHGNPMAGVKFALEDANGKVLRDLISDKDGIVHVADLVPGTYVIREIETLEGFSRTNETIQVVIDERYIVPEAMKQLVNYPILQTGVDVEWTPVMWTGAGLMLAAFAVLAAALTKRKRRHGPH